MTLLAALSRVGSGAWGVREERTALIMWIDALYCAAKCIKDVAGASVTLITPLRILVPFIRATY